MKKLLRGLILRLWLAVGFMAMAAAAFAGDLALDEMILEYDGKPMRLSDFRKECTETANTDALTEQVVKYAAPDGKLEVRFLVRSYRDFPVFEYSMWLTNLSGEEPTATLSHILPFQMTLPIPDPEQEVTLHTIRGSQCRADDFIPESIVIPAGGAEALSNDSGRSSSGWIPFLELSLSETSGRLFAIGWTGSWQAHFAHWTPASFPGISENSVNVILGTGIYGRESRFQLAPGETIRQPSVTIFTREGMSRREFQTVVHRFMLTHKVPRDSKGNVIPPILAVASGGGNKTPKMMLDVLDYCQKNQLPFDTYWVDAGWYGAPHEDELYSNCGPSWWKYVGDWRVNTTTHPTGDLLPIADAVHAAGMKFLLWFEPERMTDGAPILEAHPEFRHGQPSDFGQLVDFGNPEALKWIQDTVYGMIEKHQIDVYRQDFNMDPQAVWDSMDAESGAPGLAAARHITGMYRFLDEMRAKFPDILLENCASGGRRIDIEMISRAHTYCRSDYYIGQKPNDTAFILGQNATLNTLAFLPFQGCEFNCVPVGDDYAAFSIISSGTVITPSDFDGGILRREFSAEETEWFRKVFETAVRMRPFFMGDFYPLVEPCSAANDLWCAWQAHRPDQGAGFALAFRRGENQEESRTFTLGGLEPDAEYEVEVYGGAVSVMKGADLQSWSVTLPPRAFQLIFYRKK